MGLLPGDRIVEVNGENVENCRRDNIIDRIEMSGMIHQNFYVSVLKINKSIQNLENT